MATLRRIREVGPYIGGYTLHLECGHFVTRARAPRLGGRARCVFCPSDAGQPLARHQSVERAKGDD